MVQAMVKACAFAIAVGLAVWASAVPVPAARLPLVSEHRYRIMGKARLLLFWIGANDVGRARATWRSDSVEGDELALLIGSDPERAPRGVNEWGYIREQVRGDDARVFGVRTVADADSPDAARASLDSRDGRAVFGAICSRVTAQDVMTSVATVTGPADVSYRRIDRLLDALAAHRSWEPRHIGRPAGTAPGFLTAFNGLLLEMAASARTGRLSATPPTAYVYKDAVFDLNADRVERIAELKTSTGVFRNLVRAEFTIRNRRLRGTTRFDATFGIEGALAGVPIQATYQPSWWFKIRLDLDDDLSVPAEPSGDDLLRQRVDEVCARASDARREAGDRPDPARR
jgi:hypothetical protein